MDVKTRPILADEQWDLIIELVERSGKNFTPRFIKRTPMITERNCPNDSNWWTGCLRF